MLIPFGEGARAIAALVPALMINHGLWSNADAAPRPATAYSISQSKPKLLLPEFDILQMVSPANYRIDVRGSTAIRA